MTTLSDMTDVTVWPITSTPNPNVLKIENRKINQKRMKRKENEEQLSLQSSILTDTYYPTTKFLWSVRDNSYSLRLFINII